MICPFRKEDFLTVKQGLLDNVEKKGIDSISEYCTLTAIPLIVAYEFVLEEMPQYTEQCNNKISSIKEFYGYGS